MDETQDLELTRPLSASESVFYRCTCGTESKVTKVEGGTCQGCGHVISPKTLQHDLAMTMTLGNLTGASVDSIPGTPTESLVKDDLIGKTLGHFEIMAPLGRGGMGQVYQALDKSLQRYVAVKVLLRGKGSSNLSTTAESQVDELLQEAVAQARVTHPHIVTIYYVGKQDGISFLAMELVNGEPMSQYIGEHGLDFSVIGPVAIQVADALRFSFELDIIHGDIKPSNIILQSNGLAKLSDFGMARNLSEETSGKVGGTPNYIAPELLKGKQPSIQSDMYALGVTLYELSFGRLPITLSGQSVSTWIESHEAAKIQYPSPWPEHLPDGWKVILRRLLAADPAERYASYEALITDLDEVQPESRIAARRVPRLIAAAIDYVTVLMLMGTIDGGFNLLSFLSFDTNHPYITNILHIATFLPILMYTLMVTVWRQSVGRALMHVRVVNQYQLVPSSRMMLRRSAMRMSLMWAIAFAEFVGSVFSWGWIRITGVGLAVAAACYLLVAIGFIFLNKRNRTPHDLLLDTHVVLDTH